MPSSLLFCFHQTFIPLTPLLVFLNPWLSFLFNLASFSPLPLLPHLCSMLLYIKHLLVSLKYTFSIYTFLKTLQNPTSYITVAMPVCPRSVSCHPMGSMSFKTLQAQPLLHCRSQERSLSRETASSSSTVPRRRTTGTTQVKPALLCF